jgi:hypothetical protein
MGNWGVHVMDDALNVVLRDRVPFPKRIAAAGGRVLWGDAGQTPNICFAYYDTGSVPVLFALSNLASSTGHGDLNYRGVGSGYVIQCEGGYYAGGRGGGSAHDRDGHMIRRFTGDSGAGHQRNFVTAVHARDRSLLNAEVEIGHRSTAWCNLTDVAIRVGGPYSHDEATRIGQPLQPWTEIIDMLERESALAASDVATPLHLSPVLEFDAATEHFNGKHAAQANSLLHREYRQPFEVHAVV